MDSSGRPSPDRARRRYAWIGAACVLFAAASASLYAPLLGEDLREAVPTLAAPVDEPAASGWDRRFVVWLVAGNARSLTAHPWRPFDTGTCHPAERTLALGHPALSLGLLAVPGWLASGDPVASYNLALFLQTLLAAFAMYWFVAEFSQDRAAGIVAGLGYAFLAGKTGLVAYPFHGDTAWMLLAFVFARRLLDGGGFGAALGFAAVTALQLSAGFYTTLAAAALGLPMGIWLLRTRGVGRLRPLPVALAGVCVVVAAATLFSPYLEEQGVAIASRRDQVFAAWPYFLGLLGASLPITGLALAGLLLPPRPDAPPCPRFALAAGAVLAGLLAGSSTLYSALAGWIPGLGNVRVPLLVSGGTHLAWCALAGFGAARLLGSLGAMRDRVALALLAVVFVDVVRPPLPGLPPRPPYQVAPVRPEADALAFYAELAALGNRGPVFEASLARKRPLPALELASRSVLRQAYHGRRTSACYNSFIPESVRALRPLAERLPDPEALRELAGLGFTTLVVERTGRGPHPFEQRIARAGDRGEGLVPILSRGDRSAYVLP